MLNPDDLIDKLADVLTGLNAPRQSLGDKWRVIGYKDAFPSPGNLRQAIIQQPLGSIMVVWMGTDKARYPGDRSGAWSFRHKFSFMVKAAPNAQTYGQIWSAFVNGDGSVLTAPIHMEIDPDCDPMDREGPIAQRNSMLVSVDGETLDYFEFQATLIEKGA